MDDDQEWAQLVAYEQYNTCDKCGGEMRVVSVSPRKGYYEVRLECPSCEYGLRVRVRPLDIAARKTVG